MNLRYKKPSTTRNTLKSDPCCDTAEEAFARLQEYRDSMELPENKILKAQRSFQYTEITPYVLPN